MLTSAVPNYSVTSTSGLINHTRHRSFISRFTVLSSSILSFISPINYYCYYCNFTRSLYRNQLDSHFHLLFSTAGNSIVFPRPDHNYINRSSKLSCRASTRKRSSLFSITWLESTCTPALPFACRKHYP